MRGVNRRKNTGKPKKNGEQKPPVLLPATSSGEWLSSDDGLKLFVRQWVPSADRGDALPVRGSVHIVHGMAEHSGRYERIARRLCKAGFAVWAADMRGHGKTADTAINDPSIGGQLGHCADADGIAKVAGDIHFLTRLLSAQYPDTPVFLLGHSWGSFLAQYYIETYPDPPLGGCILSGTRGPDGFRVKAGGVLVRFLAWAKGVRKRSAIARAAADGLCNQAFKPSRTPFDWLSRDESAVDAYLADPFCRNRCTVGFYRDLAFLLEKIHRPEALEKIRKDLPVYVFGGTADPVGDMGESPTALVTAYQAAGMTDLTFVLYPEARHETLHETNYEEVSDNLADWLIQRASPAEAVSPLTPEKKDFWAENKDLEARR